MKLSQGEGYIPKVVALLQPQGIKARHSVSTKGNFFTKTNWDVWKNKQAFRYTFLYNI